ncbi:hypothetical protein RHMOL_Rhmol07G0172400 [Rhododendron molle]|uniref:Uncharacterized protein n=1 Tax=Rhododendron molle TaxID=49168 RepID=A0ACC0N1L3_RHOML|nr:hypothetical protein RHMOL_Rhmol07G0172400 [Rhododendron molle]
MRKLAPPNQDGCTSKKNNSSEKSLSSQEKSGFKRTLSRSSLDMALRHMHIQEILSSETDVIAKTGDSWFNCLRDVGMRATTFIEPFLLIEYKWNGIDEGKVCPFGSERIHELDGKVYDLKQKEVPLLPLKEELEDEIAKSGGGSLAPQDNATLFTETKVLSPKSSEISAMSNVGTPAVPPPNAALTSTGVATSTITNDSVQNTPQG